MIYKRIPVFSVFLSLAVVFGLSGEELETDVLLEKAKLQFIWKNYDNAVQLAEKVLKADPKNTDAMMIVAQVYYINGRYSEAKAYFEKIIGEGQAPATDLMRDYGIILKSSGDYRGATKFIEMYLVEHPDDSLAGYHLAETYYRLGEKDKAESQLRKVIQRKDEQMIPASVMLSEIFLSQGRGGEAEDILKNLEKERLSQLSDQIVSGLYGRAAVMREQYKRFSLEFSAGAGYDTNGIYLTGAEKDEDIAKDSAFSEVSADIVYNPLITGKKRLYLGLGISKNFYFSETAKQFDRLLLNPKTGYKFYTNDDRSTFLDFGYEYNNLFFAGGERVGFDSFGTFYQSNALFGEVNHRFGRTTGVARYMFSFDEFYDHNRSGFSHRLVLVSSFPVLKKGSLYLGPVFGLEDARLNIYDFFTAGATAGLQFRFFRDFSLVLSGLYEHRNYFDNKDERNDNIILFSAKAEYFVTKNIFVGATASCSSVDSSLKTYSYDRCLFCAQTGFYY